MLHRFLIATALLAFAPFAWAAKKEPLPLPIADRLPVELVLSQHELVVDVPDNSAMGAQFGLIGALISSGIDNAAAKKAEGMVAPLRNSLISYSFNERFEAALRAKIAAQGLSLDPQVHVINTAAGDTSANTDQPVPYVLTITPRFAMDTGFGSMYVRLNAMVLRREAGRNGKIKTRYVAVRSYRFAFPIAATKPEENARTWAGIPGDAMQRMLDRGIEQVTDMLVYDFSAEGRPGWDLREKGVTTRIGSQTYPGRELRRGDEWAWVRGGARSSGLVAVVVPESILGVQPIDPATSMRAATEPAPSQAPQTTAAPDTTASPVATPTPGDQR